MREQPRAVISAWVPVSVADELRAVAALHDRSMSGELRYAVRRHLETSESPAGKPNSRDSSGGGVAGNVVSRA